MSENPEKQIVEKNELEEMFDRGFLSKVQTFCERVATLREEENLEKASHFLFTFQMLVYPSEFPLNFEKGEKYMSLLLGPVTQSEIEASKKIEEVDSLPT